jgi:hypothetical protein
VIHAHVTRDPEVPWNHTAIHSWGLVFQWRVHAEGSRIEGRHSRTGLNKRMQGGGRREGIQGLPEQGTGRMDTEVHTSLAT